MVVAPLPRFHDGVSGEVQTACADDLTPAAGTWLRPEAAPGLAALVVLVPGMGDLRASYRFLAPALKEAGYPGRLH
jgi:alpha-beta hydrolase superfamily lysophospholipase